MQRQSVVVIGVAALVAVTLACGRTSNNPTSPSAAATAASNASSDGSTLKATAPVPQSPINDQRLEDSLPTFTASAAAAKFGGDVALQYRFQIFNPAGALVQDSGLVSGTSWKIPNELEFNSRHTWRVRAEYQGAAGPWSSTASFLSQE